uniref:Uncharacterized protein n=1 Tax=Trichogramma kaykai TaxID=54128 RepID=A0ABD2WTR3_9HYME
MDKYNIMYNCSAHRGALLYSSLYFFRAIRLGSIAERSLNPEEMKVPCAAARQCAKENFPLSIQSNLTYIRKYTDLRETPASRIGHTRRYSESRAGILASFFFFVIHSPRIYGLIKKKGGTRP